MSTEEGIVKYGPTYKSLYYFAAIHNDGGANPICDEFHRNSGFLTNHVFLGAFLEQSLQLVNPRTCLHYWEYVQSFSSGDFQNHSELNQIDLLDCLYLTLSYLLQWTTSWMAVRGQSS